MIMLTTAGIVLLFSIIAIFMWRTVCYGRRCAERGHEHMTMHKRAVNFALITVIPLIVLIEVFAHFLSETEPPAWMLGVHLLFAIPFLTLLLVLRFFVTGERIPKYHRPIAYFCVAAFVGTLTTGVTMLTLLNLAVL